MPVTVIQAFPGFITLIIHKINESANYQSGKYRFTNQYSELIFGNYYNFSEVSDG